MNSQDVFSINAGNQAIQIRFRDQDRSHYSIILHPGWLFAGCSFEGADFDGKDPPDQFEHYIQGPVLPEAVPEAIPEFDDESFDDYYFDMEDDFT